MELKTIEYDVSERIATITLSRPERMNAWTGRMNAEYRYVLQEADNDAAVRAIIVTGAGRGFCVGADSRALAGHVERGEYDSGITEKLAEPGFGTRAYFDAEFAYHFGLSKPVIAAINGPAAGVGLVLACYADIRFAAPGVKLTAANGKLNLPAEFGLSWLLPRMIGIARSNDLLFTCRVFVSDEAAEMGLIHKIVEPEALIPETRRYVLSMIENVSPSSLRQMKWQTYSDLHSDVAEAVVRSKDLVNEMVRESDFKEGVGALVEKRKPRWRGP